MKTVLRNKTSAICIAIGGFYMVFGLLDLCMIIFQKMMISDIGQFPGMKFTNMLSLIHGIWIIYMPLMILLGIAYLIFGLLFHQISSHKFQINLVLSALSLIWVLAYVISCLPYMHLLISDFAFGQKWFGSLIYIITAFGFLVVFSLFTLPQFIIGMQIRKQNSVNSIAEG